MKIVALLQQHFDQYWMFWVFGVVFAVLFINFIVRRLLAYLLTKAHQTQNMWDDTILSAAKAPIEWGIWLFGINFAVKITALANDLDEWIAWVTKLNMLAFVILIALFLARLVSRTEGNITSKEYLQNPVDQTTAKAIRKLLHASIWITASLIVLEFFGVSVSGVLAFGGIGGIAIGFAARDLLANFFGAVTIYLDKPFSAGDWIRSPDREIEGTVEDIGWRQTTIRTFDKRPLYVPNSVFTSISVENPSRMSNRRIYETIGVRYQDADKLTAIIDDVKAMLETHSDLDMSQTLIVALNKFSASSIDFFIYTFTKTVNWVEYHGVKQDVLIRIENIIRENNAEIAFPTSTVHVSTDDTDNPLTLMASFRDMPASQPQTPVETKEKEGRDSGSSDANISQHNGDTGAKNSAGES